MNSIIKNISKVLALTTTVSSFAILPSAAASGNEPTDIPPTHGSSSPSISYDDVLTQLGEIESQLGAGSIILGASFLGKNLYGHNVDPTTAYDTLKTIASFLKTYIPKSEHDFMPLFATSYREHLQRTQNKLFIGSFDDGHDSGIAAIVHDKIEDARTKCDADPQLGYLTYGYSHILFDIQALSYQFIRGHIIHDAMRHIADYYNQPTRPNIALLYRSDSPADTVSSTKLTDIPPAHGSSSPSISYDDVLTQLGEIESQLGAGSIILGASFLGNNPNGRNVDPMTAYATLKQLNGLFATSSFFTKQYAAHLAKSKEQLFIGTFDDQNSKMNDQLKFTRANLSKSYKDAKIGYLTDGYTIMSFNREALLPELIEQTFNNVQQYFFCPCEPSVGLALACPRAAQPSSSSSLSASLGSTAALPNLLPSHSKPATKAKIKTMGKSTATPQSKAAPLVKAQSTPASESKKAPSKESTAASSHAGSKHSPKSGPKKGHAKQKHKKRKK